VALFASGAGALVSVRSGRNAYRAVSAPRQLLGPLAGVLVTLGFLVLIQLVQSREVLDPTIVAMAAILVAGGVAVLGLRWAGQWLETHAYDFARQMNA
jgi:hypothetical protein